MYILNTYTYNIHIHVIGTYVETVRVRDELEGSLKSHCPNF